MRMRFKGVLAAATAISALVLSGPAFGQATNNCPSGFMLSSSGSTCVATSTTNQSETVKVYAAPHVSTAGNSTARCIKRWDFSVSAVLAGVGVGIPEKDQECMELVRRELALKATAEQRANVALAAQMCASLTLTPRDRVQICAAAKGALLALLAVPAPRAEDSTKIAVAHVRHVAPAANSGSVRKECASEQDYKRWLTTGGC